MIQRAENASLSSVFESQRLFEEIDEFVSQLHLKELEEAKLKVYKAKFKLDMEVPKLSKCP